MTLPRAPEARRFYQAARQRLDDAKFLLEGLRTTASMYLAGYAVECILKALILSLLPDKDQLSVVQSFRGAKAHDYDWLITQYLGYHGIPFPPTIIRRFALVNTWTTDIRYRPGTIKEREATEFLRAAEQILEWADGRL